MKDNSREVLESQWKYQCDILYIMEGEIQKILTFKEQNLCNNF